MEDKKTEEKEVKQEEKAEVQSNVQQPKARKLIIETDGDNINIVLAEVTVLEMREIGRQLQNIK